MNLCEWSEAWEIGEESIDTQHRRWVHLVNLLYTSLMEGRSQETLEPLLREAAEYTRTHFDAEERIMRRAGYPEYEHHQAIHDAFRLRVQRLQQEMATGAPLTVPVMQALWEWLVDHIRREDQKIGAHLQSLHVKEDSGDDRDDPAGH